jgi:hypothetical protein
MKQLSEYIHKELLNEASEVITLPYNFDIYNEGSKNTNFDISKKVIFGIWNKLGEYTNIRPIYRNGKDIGNYEEEKYHIEHTYASEIILPLAADYIGYMEKPNPENTENWTVIPELRTYTIASTWSGRSPKEKKDYNEAWEYWFRQLKPYMKGKISATIEENRERVGHYEIRYRNKPDLLITINDPKFEADRQAKIKELTNPDILKEWKANHETEESRKEEQRRKEWEEHQKEKARKEEEFRKWWDSLDEIDRMRWNMGYGRGSGSWTGD